MRFCVGVALGGGALLAYLVAVGVDDVAARAAAIAPWALGLVVAAMVAEGLVDSLGVWASVAPLGRGLSGGRSVQFAFAGDFFDILSPAGPASSEPIMARFIGVATGTSYSEALGVRAVAKYVKVGGQLCASVAVGAVVLFDGTGGSVVLPLGGAVAGLVVVAGAVVWAREPLSTGIVVVLAPVVRRVSGLYRDDPHDRPAVARAVERFWARALGFRGSPGLVVLIAVAGVAEQSMLAVALWTALEGTGTAAALLPILVVVPLPRVATVVPVPASVGAYDLLLSGALVVVTGSPAAAATAAVLVVRSVSVPLGLSAGGLAVAFLRGWRP